MNETERTPKSLWEHAGFPGVPNYRQEHTAESVDQVFKQHLADLRARGADTVERTEAVLAWSVLRDDTLREKLRYFYDYEVLNQATHREVGPGELLEYEEQYDKIRREAAAEAAEMVSNGVSEKRAEWVERYTVRRRHDEETSLHRPGLPGVTETWSPRGHGVKSLGLAAAWVGFTLGLVVLATLLGVAGPVAGVLTGSPVIAAIAGVGALGSVAWNIHGRYVSEPRSWNRWLEGDTRGNWPLFVWGLLAISVGVAFPPWVAALWIPVSAGVPLLVPRLRRRLLESVGGVNGAMLEPGELLLREPRFSSNRFVPANSTIQADAPAMPPGLPVRSRDGSSGLTIDSSQETLQALAEHAGLEASGLESGVHKVAGAILLDVLVATTGVDDLRLVGQYGSGSIRILARALSIGLGQELATADGEPPGVPRPGRAVAPWYVQEATAFREFAEKHLCEQDARLALRMAADVLLEARALDYPHVALYRLETLTFALTYAGASEPSSA